MPAADIPTLFDFESAYEDALANYFASINGAPFAQVVTPRSNITEDSELVTPRIAISLAITGTGDKEDFRPSGANYYSHKLASLTLAVASQRSNTAQNHGNLRGRTRQAMLEMTAALNANTLPNYQTVFVTEQSSAQTIVETNDEIVTQLTYAVEFWIPPSSWPS